MDVPPVIGRSVGWIEAERSYGVNGDKRALDLRPAVEAQEDVAARPYKGKRLERLAAADGAHDVDARNDRAMLACGPADEGEDAVGREADDAAAAVEDLFVALASEPDPVLDLAFVEGQLDQGSERRWPVRQRTAVRAVGGSAAHDRPPWRSSAASMSCSTSAIDRAAPRLACACVKEEELDSLLDSKLAV